MMHQSESRAYASDTGWQAVQLPYLGDQISMLIIVPDEGKFGDFEKNLDNDALQTIIKALHGEEVQLGFPKFKIEKTIMLADALKTMGMPTAFSDTADFSGMYSPDATEKLCISQVVHQAYVNVNEAGTEAAAATAVIFRPTMAAPSPPVDLTIDRPFVFAHPRQ